MKIPSKRLKKPVYLQRVGGKGAKRVILDKKDWKISKYVKFRKFHKISQKLKTDFQK